MERSVTGLELKAQESHTILTDAWSRKTGAFLTDTRGDLTLVLERPPGRLANLRGIVGGVTARVQLHFHFGQSDGFEVAIDQTRRIWNPPMLVVESPAEFDRDGNETKARVLRFDPLAAFLDAVWGSIERLPSPENWGKPDGTVTTIFATPHGGDDHIVSSHATYATARTGGTLVDSNGGSCGQDLTATPNYLCYELFWSFDTSAIGTDTVSEVVASGVVNTDASVTDFIIQVRETTYGASVTTADWVSGASLGGLTLFASLDTAGGLSGRETFTSDAGFLTANWGGVVEMLLCSSRLVAGNAPTGDEFVGITPADAGGTTNDPQLDVTHEAEAPATVVKDLIGGFGIIAFPR